MKEIIIDAMQDVPDKRHIRIRMNPLDAKELRSVLDDIHQAMDDIILIDIEEDSQLAHGSLIMESQGTIIDAGLASSWHRLGEELRAATPAVDWLVMAVAGPEHDDADSITQRISTGETENEVETGGMDKISEPNDSPDSDLNTDTQNELPNDLGDADDDLN